MPNFKIFQDNPEQAKVKIFGGNNKALNTDSDGNLAITSTGLAVTAPADGLLVTASADGLSITAPSGGLLITSSGLAIASATTDVSAVIANNNSTAGGPDEIYTVIGLKSWTFGVVNNALADNAQAIVKLQISPDATNWQDEAGPVTVNKNALTTLVSSIFLKYARVYYNAVNSASAVTLNIFFQGQS